MKLGPSRTKLSLRINGTRLGDAARPDAESAATTVITPAVEHLPMKRAPLRVHAALSTRPNDYMPDDDGTEIAS